MNLAQSFLLTPDDLVPGLLAEMLDRTTGWRSLPERPELFEKSEAPPSIRLDARGPYAGGTPEKILNHLRARRTLASLASIIEAFPSVPKGTVKHALWNLCGMRLIVHRHGGYLAKPGKLAGEAVDAAERVVEALGARDVGSREEMLAAERKPRRPNRNRQRGSEEMRALRELVGKLDDGTRTTAEVAEQARCTPSQVSRIRGMIAASGRRR